jgi:cold shock CspA family protein
MDSTHYNEIVDLDNVIGYVKWFNSRYGYGFITATGEETSYGDVFVHHSEINPKDNGEYKYLVQGEYVSFSLVSLNKEKSKHKYHACNVVGVNGGPLMYETKAQIREQSQRNYNKSQDCDDLLESEERNKPVDPSDGFQRPRNQTRKEQGSQQKSQSPQQQKQKQQHQPQHHPKQQTQQKQPQQSQQKSSSSKR